VFLKFIKKVTRVNGIAIGVKPEYQKKGLEAALFQHMSEMLISKNNYKDVVVTWVGDFNPKMQHIFEEIGFKPVSKMATYRYLFDRSKPFERSQIIEK
jgi:predicted GNAT family acetyltransferase